MILANLHSEIASQVELDADNREACVISIHPKYATRIYIDRKKYEFRKQAPIKKPKIYIIYETSPTSKVTGMFFTRKTISDTPSSLWKHCKDKAGIGRDAFFEYFDDSTVGHAIAIDWSFKFSNKLPLMAALGLKNPPQSFMYITLR